MDKQSKYDSLGTRWRFTVYEKGGEVVYGINAGGVQYRIAPDSFDRSKWRIDKWSFVWEAVNQREYDTPQEAARDLVRIHAVKTRGESADRLQDEMRELDRGRYFSATAETPIGSGDGEPVASKDEQASKLPTGTLEEMYVRTHGEGNKKQAAMAARVAHRHLVATGKVAFFLPYQFDDRTDVKASFRDTAQQLQQALDAAEKLPRELKAFKKKVDDLQDEAADVVREYIELVEAVDPGNPKLAYYSSTARSMAPKIRAAGWTVFMGVSNPITDFVRMATDLPRKMKVFLRNRMSTEPVRKLEGFYKGRLTKLHQANSIYEEFEREWLDSLAAKIHRLLEYNDILMPSGTRGGIHVGVPFNTSKMEAYNRLHEAVYQWSTYPSNHPDKYEAQFDLNVANLSEMIKLVGEMKKDYDAGLYQLGE